MDKDFIETLRKMQEIEYRQIDSSAVVVTELGEVDYATNETIKKYKNDGYKLIDANSFGEGIEQCGELLVFVLDKEKRV